MRSILISLTALAAFYCIGSCSLNAQEEEENSDSAKGAARFYKLKRWQGEGEIPADRYLKARDQMRRSTKRRLGARSTAAANAGLSSLPGGWQALGPGNIGGRVRALVIDPKNSKTIYAGSATGGVWKTTDGGQSWTALTDTLPVLAVYSLAMDPTNSQILYLGSGESAQRGDGIFKTVDGGKTWRQLPGTGSNPDFYYVHSIAISPKRPLTVYAATETGLFLSTDGGSNWKQQTLTSDGSPTSCNSVVVNGTGSADTAFVACGLLSDFEYSIYRNIDAAGAGAWQVVKTENGMAATALAIAPSAPSTVYAISDEGDPSSKFSSALHAVFRSTSNGDPGSWTTQISVNATNAISLGANILSRPQCPLQDHTGQGEYNLAIAVDPTNADTVFVGGIDLFRSTDGGVTWSWMNTFGETRQDLGSSHVDQHIFAFDPGYNGTTNQLLYSGNDGGVYSTSTALAGSNATDFCADNVGAGWTALNNDFAVTQFYYGTVLPGGAAYFGGAQDNGTVFGNDQSGLNGWVEKVGGDGGDVYVDPVDPNTQFYSVYNLSLQKSTDGGLSIQSAVNGIAEPGADFNFIAAYTADPENTEVLYIGGQQLWRTVDSANNWTAASAPVQNSEGAISTVAVSPWDSNTVYFGTDFNAIVYRSSIALTSDGTTPWTPVQLQQSGYVSSISFDPNNANRVYATVSTFNMLPGDAHIYVSNDRGVTWSAVGNSANGLPDLPVSTLIVDPDQSSTLYIGTDLGVFASFDTGATWSEGEAPFADAMVESLVLRKENGAKTLYAFSYGRGAWKVNLSGAPSTCTFSLSTGQISVPGDLTEGSLTVTTQAGCTWTAQPGSGFVTVLSPGSGTGPGTVYYRVPYNDYGFARNDTFYVQSIPVTVAQAAMPVTDHTVPNDNEATPHTVAPLPYEDVAYSPDYTSETADPVHSCTSKADMNTAWWAYTATQSTPVAVTARGEAYDFYGDAGIVITAYPLVKGVLGKELGCTNIPQNQNLSGYTNGTLIFSAEMGMQYAIEISTTSTERTFTVMNVAQPPVVNVTPATVSLQLGKQQQFTAMVTATPDTAVRWTLSPIVGVITPSGLYTAPAETAAAANVTVTARSLADGTAIGAATVKLPGPPISFTAAGVSNAASYQTGAVAPGEIITVFGNGIGPASLAGLQLDATGKVATMAGGTQALFDGVPAPMIYASSGQISTIVPYHVYGQQTTQLAISYNGLMSAPVTLNIADAVPALFTANASGTGQASIVNQDGTVNSSQSPAPRGSIVAFFGTGEGQTSPAGTDGKLATAPFPAPLLPVTVTIGGQPAKIYYAGAAPGETAGVIQINAAVPAGITPGAVPVVIHVGDKTSLTGVTMSVSF